MSRDAADPTADETGFLGIGLPYPEPLAVVAIDLAVQAGRLVADARRGGVTVSDVKSSPVDIVTDLDTAAENLIRQGLLRLRPDDGVLGEEFGYEPGRSGITWVVDPIDGTVNFLYGIPGYAVSIAAVTGDPTRPGAWAPVAACVHAPAQGRTYRATAGGGAWLDEERTGTSARLAVNPPADLDRALVGTGFGYRAERRAAQGRVVAEILPQVRDIRRAGCASLDLCAVAAGALDAYYEQGLHAWDLAAGLLVVSEAGGVVRGLGEEPPGEAMVLAGPAPLVARLDRLLAALGAGCEEPEAR